MSEPEMATGPTAPSRFPKIDPNPIEVPGRMGPAVQILFVSDDIAPEHLARLRAVVEEITSERAAREAA